MTLTETGADFAAERREWAADSGCLRPSMGNLIEDGSSAGAPGKGLLSSSLRPLVHPRFRYRWRGQAKFRLVVLLPIA